MHQSVGNKAKRTEKNVKKAFFFFIDENPASGSSNHSLARPPYLGMPEFIIKVKKIGEDDRKDSQSRFIYSLGGCQSLIYDQPPEVELAERSATWVYPNLFLRPVKLPLIIGKSMEYLVPVKFLSLTSPIFMFNRHSYAREKNMFHLLSRWQHFVRFI